MLKPGKYVGPTIWQSIYGNPWQLVLSEDFNSLDHSVWSRSEGPLSDTYLRPEHIDISGSDLRAKVTDDVYKGENYTGGEVTSQYKFEFRYGKVEARIKPVSGQGLWCGLWMFETISTFAEIDIAEYLGRLPNRMYMVYHWNDGGPQAAVGFYDGADFSADYHIYSMEWSPTEITFSIDGVQRHSVVNDFIHDDYMYLRFSHNTGIDDGWAELPDGTTPFPSHAVIDWLRVYQREKDFRTPYLANATFESGNLTGTTDSFVSTVGGEDLAVTNAAALNGTINGLEITIDDLNQHIGRLRINPFHLGKYFRGRVYIDPNSLTMGVDEAFIVANALSSFGPWASLWIVRLGWDGATFFLQFAGNDDAINWDRVGSVDITDAPHYFEVACARAESDVSADGSLEFLVDGVQIAAWTNEDNYDFFGGIEYFDTGVVGEVDAGTSGVFYVDEIKYIPIDQQIGAAG